MTGALRALQAAGALCQIVPVARQIAPVAQQVVPAAQKVAAWQGDDRVGQLLAATVWRKVVNGNTSTKMSTRYILDYTGDPKL